MPIIKKQDQIARMHLLQEVANYLDAHYVPVSSFPMAAPSPVSNRTPKKQQDCSYGVKEILPCPPTAVSKALSLAEILKQEDAGFSETLLRKIDESGKKDSQIYKKANLSKQHFSKIRNNPNYKPTKATAIALALALELDLEQTKDLIGRAGYALTNSSKFDLIIRYFIQQRKYNVTEINMVLYEFDQPLLGS